MKILISDLLSSQKRKVFTGKEMVSEGRGVGE